MHCWAMTTRLQLLGWADTMHDPEVRDAIAGPRTLPAFFLCLQLLGQGMRDADAEVRGDAVSALSQMAEHCTEGLAKYHTQVVPALIHVLQDKSATQQQALFALETLCEDLGACRPQWVPL